MQHFESVDDYLEAFKSNPRTLGLVPIGAAAEALELARSSVERMAKDGRLTLITMPGLKGVRVQDLNDMLDHRREEQRSVVKVLEKIARRQLPPVYYDPVMAPIGLDHSKSVDRAKIGAVLGRISIASHKQHHILLSVLVHKKGGKEGCTLPSDGFFELAKSLGYRWKDDRQFVKEEMVKVYEHYKQ